MRRLLTYVGLGVGAVALLVVLSNLLVHVVSAPFIYRDFNKVPQAEVVMIPASGPFLTKHARPYFIDRADTAIAFYKAGKVSKILVSGDNSTIGHNEVNPMRTYLLSKGVPDQDIFLDHAGLNTYDSMYRAQAIFGITSMLIASQSFHLPRAVFIARALGIRGYGVNSDEKHLLLINYIREIFSDEKAVFDVVLHVSPVYLGSAIPIMGDGREYP